MPKLTLITQGSNVIANNGVVTLTISKPQGLLTGIKYAGIDNLLDTKSNELNRGYWDMNWSLPGGQNRYQLLRGSEYNVITLSNDHLEVSFKSTYDPSVRGTNLPLTVDLRYILRTGVSGFYSYAICERPPGSPAFDLAQVRMAFKLQQDRFHYMAITDEKQRIMPMPDDIVPPRGKQLIVPESVLMVNPTNPELKGEVDDKYQYSMDNKDGGLHGWISSNPMVGFWIIFPSHESRNGGPTKQNLTAHTGPACLAMFHSGHYIGDDMVAQFDEGETWRKVFGPFFVYLNTTSDVKKAHTLWLDAKRQRLMEVSLWPYDFLSSPYYLTYKERGSATGQLFVQDKFVSASPIPAKSAFVGLSVARTPGSWQTESKGYQFWIQTDSDGNFTIKNVVPGVYSLHGWVPGFIGDYFNEQLVTISPGSETQLGNLIYVPVRDGPTVWEIGYPDRTANDYFVPDVNPIYANKLFLNSSEKYRQYGLWDRYTDINPTSDQVFTVGISHPKKDWFFAHVDRKSANKYLPTTWEIRFHLNSVSTGVYKLRLAIASANRSDLQVHVNLLSIKQLVFQVQNLGEDNAVCRHGIHGLYQLFSVDISSDLLTEGNNCLYVTQARGGDPLCGIFYDYIRLEAPMTRKNDQLYTKISY